MIYKKLSFVLLLGAGVFLFSASLSDRLRVPPGLGVSVLASNLPNARQLAYDPKNNRLFVATKGNTATIYILDLDEEFRLVKRSKFSVPGAEELAGVAYSNNVLFIASTTTLWRIDNIDALVFEDEASILDARRILIDHLPGETHHGRRYLRLDEKTNSLYFGIGVPCNICAPPGDLYGVVVKADASTGHYAVVATGVRNTVGIDVNPLDGSVWFSENGRDGLGDDLPPDELNLLEEGADYGFPFIHGADVKDPFYRNPPPNFVFKKPAYNFQAHEAVLGLHFYRGSMLGKNYENALFVAKHGSWNRSKRVGYEVSVLFIRGGRVVREEKFLSGFLTRNQSVLGRPVDVGELKDGSLVVSDDRNGAVFRVFRKKTPDNSNQNAPPARRTHQNPARTRS